MTDERLEMLRRVLDRYEAGDASAADVGRMADGLRDLVEEVAELRERVAREAVGREAAEAAADALKHIIEAG